MEIYQQAHDLIERLERQDRNTMNMDCDAAAQFLTTLFGKPPPRPSLPEPKPQYLEDGYYWFKCERASARSIAQHVRGHWYTVNEDGPIDILELNRRGWILDEMVHDEKAWRPGED